MKYPTLNITPEWIFAEAKHEAGRFRRTLDALLKRRRAIRARYTFDALGSRYYESLE